MTDNSFPSIERKRPRASYRPRLQHLPYRLSSSRGASHGHRLEPAAKTNPPGEQEKFAPLKHQLASVLQPLLPHRPQLVQLALNEAEALAWQTEFPILTFPLLAEEKVQAVVAWDKRQSSILASDWNTTRTPEKPK